MIVLLWDSCSTQHRPSLGFSLALTIYCSLCMVLLYPANTLGKSEIIRPATQEANKPPLTNHKIVEDSLKPPSYDRDEYSNEDEYIESYDDDDDLNIYDELTRTESLAVVEDSINVFAKDIGAAFSDLLEDDHGAADNDEHTGDHRDVHNQNIHQHQHHHSEDVSDTTHTTNISTDNEYHNSHSHHHHSSNDDHSHHNHSDDNDHIAHDHSEHIHDDDHLHEDHLHEEINDDDILIEEIQDESFFAKMGLNPTEVKRQYFGWLRNKQQLIEQTNKDQEDKNNEEHNHKGHGHSKHSREGHDHSKHSREGHDHSKHNHEGHDHGKHNHEGHEQGHGHEGHSHGEKGRELSELSSSVWFVASASILVISLVGVMSVGFLPLLSNERGEAILQAFICIAVGTLVGDSFIHLAPHALTHSHSPETTWKGFLASMVVMAFIALDKILSFIGMNHGHSHSTVITAFEPILKNDQDKDKLTDDSFSQSSTMMVEECGSLSNASILQGNSSGNVHSHGHGKKNTNLMVIIGDAIHNFADGIAIGAAFSIGYGPGLSTSIAVLCHELPHEIGDFAILIQNGMRIKTALFYNLVSSITGFIGMCLGMIMGSKGEYSSWMIAGIMGVFLYVALVSMLPEITANSKTMLAVNIGGMVLGVVLLLVIGLYEEDIVYLLAV